MALPRPPPDLRRCSGCGGGVDGDTGGAFPKGLLDPPYAVDPYLRKHSCSTTESLKDLSTCEYIWWPGYTDLWWARTSDGERPTKDRQKQ